MKIKMKRLHISSLFSLKKLFIRLTFDNHLIETIEVRYYINICKEQNIGRDLLRKKIHNNEYNRFSFETKNKLMLNDEIEVKDLVPNPILIRNDNNIEIATEKAIHH